MKVEEDRNEFTLRVDRELWGKFKFVAEYYGRKLNEQLTFMIRESVEEFEKKIEAKNKGGSGKGSNA